MAIDIDKAVQAVNDINDAYYRWLRERLSEWMDEYIGWGIDENDASTFDHDDVNNLRAVLVKLGSNSHAELYSEIEDILAVMILNKQEEDEAGKEENFNGESKNDEVPIESAFNLDEFQSQLEAEGWMSDAEWKKFGIRQGSDYISEKVMTDIAGRWDDDRLKSFPEHSKFQFTDKELPPGRAYYTITTFDWKVTMGRFSPVTTLSSSTEENPSFVMWKLENGKNFVDWCKSAKLRKGHG